MKAIDLHLINVENEYKRAINHAFDLGWDACEERIIKLLEDLYLKRDADGNVLDTKHNEDLLYVIALIKGEK